MGDPDETDDNETGQPDAGSATSGGHSLRSAVETLESDLEELQEELSGVSEAVDELEAEIENRTVHRKAVEADLKGYVRKRVRRGHARDWGPYIVLLYGTVMTIGAFAELSGGWAILAMIVIWLSTLGLYVLMVLTGLTVAVLGTPRRAKDAAETVFKELGDRWD